MIKRMGVAAVLAMAIGLAAAAPPASAESDGTWDYYRLSLEDRYQPVAGQFGGDEATDVLWYVPGANPDTIWYPHAGQRGRPTFSKRTLKINGSYKVLVGDFAGDDADDIFWYGPNASNDYLWIGQNGGYGFTERAMPVNGNYRAAVLHDEHGGKDDIAWIGIFDSRDYIWHFDDAGSGRPLNVWSVGAAGTYEVFSGDFDGNGYGDVFLYRPGVMSDQVWLSTDRGTVARKPVTVSAWYYPVVIPRAERDDILWHTFSDDATEKLWRGIPGTPGFSSDTVPLLEDTSLVTPTGVDGTAVGLGSGQSPESLIVDDGENVTVSELAPDGPHLDAQHALPGDFDADGQRDLIWYHAGGVADYVWYHEPPA